MSVRELLLRSKLFVPASRPELFAKALAGDADALSFDLEDAVQESRKAEARQTLQTFLREIATRPQADAPRARAPVPPRSMGAIAPRYRRFQAGA